MEFCEWLWKNSESPADLSGSRLRTDIETGKRCSNDKRELHARAVHWDYRRFVYSQTCYKSILRGNEPWIEREREREIEG